MRQVETLRVNARASEPRRGERFTRSLTPDEPNRIQPRYRAAADAEVAHARSNQTVEGLRDRQRQVPAGRGGPSIDVGTTFRRADSARLRRILRRGAAVFLGWALGTTLAHAVTLYTLSNDGANPYSFSFLELYPLGTTGAFAIAPFQEGGLTFTQATLTQAGGTDCFQFGTAGATLTATPSSCGVSAFGPDGAWQSLFLAGAAPGRYTAFNAVSQGSAPAAPDVLTIQNVSAFQYTFSRTGTNPYSFSFLEQSRLDATGALAIPPFAVDGLQFTQATLTQVSGTDCFQFGTAGATLTATPFSCGLSASAPDGGWQSLFLAGSLPGTYAAFNAVSQGSAPAAPDRLTITAIPEPSNMSLIVDGLVILALLAWCRGGPSSIRGRPTDDAARLATWARSGGLRRR
jgi:hypothetical protein